MNANSLRPQAIQTAASAKPTEAAVLIGRPTAEEHTAFCKQSVEAYVAKYREILARVGVQSGWNEGIRAADAFLHETFSGRHSAEGSTDPALLAEIRPEVFRKAFEAMTQTTIDFAG